MTHEEFRLGELFCGPGGIGLGAEKANVIAGEVKYSVKHEWATDYDADTCETYRTNLNPENPDSVICEDIRKLNIQALTPIDALAFGFPCNDFSLVGEQKGIEGNFGPLYTYGVKTLKHHQPKWFLAENVGGLRSSNNGETFKLILQELRTAGYQVCPHLYRFEDYGVPQARHRIIIIGIRNDIDIKFRVPSPESYEKTTSAEAIEKPPILEAAVNHEFTKQSKTVVERLTHILPGQNAFNATLPEHLRLNVKGAKISQIYKRLDPEKPAYTVTGSGGGGTHMYHWKEARALTNRERARLQTFPDSFVFKGSKESVRKQIGMAVPVEGVRIIIEAVLKSFANVSYPSIDPNINL